MFTFKGMPVIESVNAVDPKPVEDWSLVRSPSRAARRLKQGHRQNIRLIHKPAAFRVGGTLFAHPEIVAELRRRTQEAPQ